MGVTVAHSADPRALGAAAYSVGQMETQRENAARQQEYDFRTAYQQQEMASRQQIQQADNAQRAQQWQAEQEIRRQERAQDRNFQLQTQEQAQAARAQEMEAADQYKIEAERREREWADSLTDRQRKRGMELSNIMDSLERRRGAGELNDAGYQQAIRIASVQFSDLPGPIVSALVSGRGMPKGSNSVSMADIPTMDIGGGVSWPIKMDSQGRPDPAGTLSEYSKAVNTYFDNSVKIQEVITKKYADKVALLREVPVDGESTAEKSARLDRLLQLERLEREELRAFEANNPDPRAMYRKQAPAGQGANPVAGVGQDGVSLAGESMPVGNQVTTNAVAKVDVSDLLGEIERVLPAPTVNANERRLLSSLFDAPIPTKRSGERLARQMQSFAAAQPKSASYWDQFKRR
jgi:hypothetical protein